MNKFRTSQQASASKEIKIFGCFSALLLVTLGCSEPRSRSVMITPLPESGAHSCERKPSEDSPSEPLRPHGLMGRGLYAQKSSNGCLFCHGDDGRGGAEKSAADLTRPKTWKVYLALGGDRGYHRDPKTFLAHMKTATVALIRDGAIVHNEEFKEPWFNWNTSGMAPYNDTMVGLKGSASQWWLSHFHYIGMTPNIAAEAAWIHVTTFDTQNIFPKPEQ